MLACDANAAYVRDDGRVLLEGQQGQPDFIAKEISYHSMLHEVHVYHDTPVLLSRNF